MCFPALRAPHASRAFPADFRPHDARTASLWYPIHGHVWMGLHDKLCRVNYAPSTLLRERLGSCFAKDVVRAVRICIERSPIRCPVLSAPLVHRAARMQLHTHHNADPEDSASTSRFHARPPSHSVGRADRASAPDYPIAQ